MKLSEYLEMIRETPGLYIGPETPERLEAFILGFDAATEPDYHQHINRNRGPYNRGISGLETFEEAFQAALEGAKDAEDALEEGEI